MRSKSTIALFLLALLATLALASAGATAAEIQTEAEKAPGPDDRSFTLKVGDLERRYTVHIPSGYESQKPAPVVMMFHGAGGTARGAMRQTGWSAKADAAGFLAVFPEAVSRDPFRPPRFKDNPQIWNDGSGRGHAGRRNIDDVGFAKAVIDDLRSRFALDERRIYATGFSNGASMAFRVGAELSERIAAIAPVSGLLWLEHPKLKRPVPLIYLIGAEDPFNPLQGVESRMAGRKTNPKPSARASVERWAELLGCVAEPREVANRDGVKVAAYDTCRKESEVIVYTIEGMGHTWPGGRSRLPEWMVGKTTSKLNANDVIWEFFEKHPLGTAKSDH